MVQIARENQGPAKCFFPFFFLVSSLLPSFNLPSDPPSIPSSKEDKFSIYP